MRRIFFILILCPALLFARKGTIEAPKEGEIQPWFTGPMLCPTSNVVAKGSYNIEPYLFVSKTPALYDNDWHAQTIPTEWSIQAQFPIWVGLTDWCDITFNPTVTWNHDAIGGGAWTLGDLIAQFDFQIWHQNWSSDSWVPSIKVALRESIPIGKYRNLNPKKNSADEGGTGSWISTFQLVFGRLTHFSGTHFLNCRLALQTNFYNSTVHVKGYNAYGGGLGANGRVRPGRNATLDLGLEYSLSRNWALALDIVGYWEAKSKFEGYGGIDFLRGTPTTVAQASSIQYSLAPAIEYNWSANLGVIAGAWFTVAGKQISEFYTFVFAVNYYK